MYSYNGTFLPNANFQDGNDRFFPFLFPFLGGALIGGAAVGLSQPRPVYVQAPPVAYPPYGYPYGTPYGSGYNYGNSGYYNYR